MKRLLVVTLLVLVASASASAATLPGFRSPSGNISCLFIPSGSGNAPAAILCKLAHADYAQTLQARCHGLDWHGFLLPAAKKGAVNCSGGILYNPSTQHPSYVTLAYGKTWRQKMFSCTVQLAGVNCSNPHGHGIFISRQTWRTW